MVHAPPGVGVETGCRPLARGFVAAMVQAPEVQEVEPDPFTVMFAPGTMEDGPELAPPIKCQSFKSPH